MIACTVCGYSPFDREDNPYLSMRRVGTYVRSGKGVWVCERHIPNDYEHDEEIEEIISILSENN